MDRRYFHGIRTAAAAALTKHAKDELDWVGLYHLEKAFQELFCYTDSSMTRSNDFSDRASYYIQCAIPQAIAKVQDNDGRAPMRIRTFLLEKLRFNDNTDNEVGSLKSAPLNMLMSEVFRLPLPCCSNECIGGSSISEGGPELRSLRDGHGR